MLELLTLYKKGTQKYRILEWMIYHNDIEVWRMVTPRPNGLGVALYTARITEMRRDLSKLGYEIVNDDLKYELKKITSQYTII